MKDKIKVVQYGCGKMSKYTMRYVYENGGEIIGAFDIDKDKIGKDISYVMETENKNVLISDISNAKEILKTLKPDICIITTMSLIKDVYDAFKLCAQLGINAVSTCEEAFYPFNSSPKLIDELDNLAKKNNCTLTGSGYQDAFWGNLITTIAGATHNITKIKGSSSYNVEDYGLALAKVHGAGLSLEEFAKDIAASDNISENKRNELIQKGEFLPSYMWNTNGWLASKLGLTVISQEQKMIPQTSKSELYSDTLKMTIQAGYATGMSAVVTTKTKEGIIIESECVGKVYSKDEFDKNEWTVYGEPDTTITVSRPSTVELTCASIVNRIPDVINADPGFITTDKMNNLKYPVKSLNEYIK